jgi:predicted ATPase
MSYQFLHEPRTVQQGVEALTALCNEHGYLPFLGAGIIWRGWVLAEQGQAEEGIQQIQQGMAAARARGIELLLPQFLALLAEACGKTEQVEEGLNALAEALMLVEKNGERLYEAELYRLKGELTLQKEARDWGLGTGSSSPQASRLKAQVPNGVELEAEGYFLNAINIAQQQQAKSWELRASTSLARLWQRQGKTTEAHRTLSEVYHWFTEGFDTKDLQEAKALLAELK